MARWKGKRVLITSGPTREYLDPVRFLTNASSGRMGAALARQALRRGARVTVVTGPAEAPLPARAEAVPVVSALEMREAVLSRCRAADVLIAAAAVGDWRPSAFSPRKLKRSGASLRLTLKPNPDIIKSAARRRRRGQILVGFALETHERVARAAAKMKSKGLDLIVANGPRSLGSSAGSATLLRRDGLRRALSPRSKDALASAILDAVEELW